MRLINLAFADDLIVACKADRGSIKVILECLQHFKEVTRLEVNYSKSQMILGGISDLESEEILGMTNMAKGVFPFRYLGGPITDGRIGDRECEALVAKLTAKISVWASKNLSYAGRCKLINTVLYGVISFWCRLFIIPNRVMQKIQSICRNFLWGAKAQYTKIPLVNWDEICKAKQAGGLGFRDLVSWNLACNHRLLWDIASKKDILWVKWIHNKYLKKDNIWTVPPKPNFCYYLKKILLRRKDFEGMPIRERYDVQGGYEWLMGDNTKVQWNWFVWNKLTIPKHQFIQWLGWKDRLQTKTRLARYMNISTHCVLCSVHIEDKEHMFYSCPYTRGIQNEICNWVGTRWIANNDKEMLGAIQQIKGRKNRGIAIAAFAAICYAVWKARNKKIMKKGGGDYSGFLLLD
ncbi:unnamed protein product [Cuscuta campestris]|uniref:Reverse transcriptase zinc-binding domain-containing protein n=1 Tax=Cuscuta campestris TaxID=132261 RepID=A0A484N5S8_9ASTE|nr:unnamed protein product [Cuscuta campestris]